MANWKDAGRIYSTWAFRQVWFRNYNGTVYSSLAGCTFKKILLSPYI